MKETDNHLDIDLEFLDKKEPLRVAPKSDSDKGQISSGPTVSSAAHYNWKKILIIGGIILFFGWAIYSDNRSSNTPSTNTSAPNVSSSSNNNVATGQYMCSQANHDRASQLEPNKSQETILTSEDNSLTSEGKSLLAEKDRLQNEYVDESNQFSVSVHNTAIDNLNNRLDSYKTKLNQHTQSIDAYNAKVEEYNNFLTTNCTPQ